MDKDEKLIIVATDEEQAKLLAEAGLKMSAGGIIVPATEHQPGDLYVPQSMRGNLPYGFRRIVKKGRHQGAKEKTRRLRQLARQKAKAAKKAAREDQ